MCALLRKRQEHSQPRYCVEIRCNEHLLDMFCQRKIARQRSGCYICYLYCFFQSVLYILQHRLAHTQSPVKMYAKSVPGCHAVEAASSVHQITDRDYVLATLSPACYLNRHHYITPHSIPQSPSAPLLPEVLLHFRFPHRLVPLVHDPDGDIIEPLGVPKGLLILWIPPLSRLPFVVLTRKRVHVEVGSWDRRVASAGSACRIVHRRRARHNFETDGTIVWEKHGFLDEEVFVLFIELKSH